MKTVTLALAVVFLIVGIHQSFYFGIQASYWSFMLSGFSYLAFEYLKRQDKATDPSESPTRQRAKKKKKASK